MSHPSSRNYTNLKLYMYMLYYTFNVKLVFFLFHVPLVFHYLFLLNCATYMVIWPSLKKFVALRPCMRKMLVSLSNLTSLGTFMCFSTKSLEDAITSLGKEVFNSLSILQNDRDEF